MHQKIIHQDSEGDPSAFPLKYEFHEVLSLIIGNARGALTAMAPRLGHDRSNLGRYMRGFDVPSQQLVNENEWRVVFKECCPEAWAKYEQDFERAFASLSALKGARRNKVGEDEEKIKDGGAHPLWLTLGGEKIDRPLAAKRLKISLSYLNKVFDGKKRVSQSLVDDKGWREVFKEYYSGPWAKYEAYFEEWFTTLRGWSSGKSKRPEDEKSFGFILWCIIGGEDAGIAEAAKLLGIGRTRLTDIIHGRKKIAIKTTWDMNWPHILKENFPETWKVYREDFERLVGIGPILSLIMGEGRGVPTAMATRLRVDRPDLSRYVNGHAKLSQQVVIENGWRDVLKEHCPKTWPKFERVFEEIFATLPVFKGEKYKTSERREPQNKDSFGYILWQIIDGKHARITLAAKSLGIDRGYLSKIMRGQVEVSQELIAKHNWEEVLALHHSENWEKYKKEFRRRAEMLPLVRYADRWFVLSKRQKDGGPDLKAAIGKIVSSSLKLISGKHNFERGLVLAVKSASNEMFRKPDVWHQIKYGSEGLGLEVYVVALKEVCSFTQDKDRTLHRTAQQLMNIAEKRRNGVVDSWPGQVDKQSEGARRPSCMPYRVDLPRKEP